MAETQPDPRLEIAHVLFMDIVGFSKSLINAQRVMDCGDAGHILLSKRSADDLAQYGRWRPHLHGLGQCEVKHGVRLDVVNFHSDEAGNPALPEKLKEKRRSRRLPSREV